MRYCHWKGDPRGIAAALSGTSDLDLLIDPRHAEAAAAALARSGFKRCPATPLMHDPAVEDYLALDVDRSRVLHCHVHYFLIVGEPFLKGYRLRWEEHLLATRRHDTSGTLYVPEPTLELLLLWTRVASRLRWRDCAAMLLGGPCLTSGAAAEHAWLHPRVDAADAAALCTDLLGPRVTPTFVRLLTGGITVSNVLRFRRSARAALRTCRLYPPLGGRVLRWHREVATALARLNRRGRGLSRPLRRVPPAGGVMVAFLGPDGAGKSTLTRALASLLRPKLDVHFVYFGSGDGPGSLLRWPLRVARAASERLGLLSGRGPDGRVAPAASMPGPRRRAGPLQSLALGLWAFTLALEKRRKLRTAWRARRRGMIVLADRYPQAQLPGFNDGPLLDDFSRRGPAALRALARFEAGPYHWAAQHPPDVIVKLIVTRDTAHRRKPETGAAEVARRIDAIKTLAFPRASVVEIDADRPLAEVLRDVATVVWSHI